jgi:hypothetical protein
MLPELKDRVLSFARRSSRRGRDAIRRWALADRVADFHDLDLQQQPASQATKEADELREQLVQHARE